MGLFWGVCVSFSDSGHKYTLIMNGLFMSLQSSISEAVNCQPVGVQNIQVRIFSVVSLQPLAQGRTSPTKMLQNGSPSKCPRFLKIKNWENGTVYNDTLHHSSSKVRCRFDESFFAPIDLPPALSLRRPSDEDKQGLFLFYAIMKM